MRRTWQDELLGLPPLPTTTIGSYPQAPQIRQARLEIPRGRIDRAEDVRRMGREIESVIRLPEELGLTVNETLSNLAPLASRFEAEDAA